MWEDSGVLGDDARVAVVVVRALLGLRVGAFYQTLKKYVNILIIDVPLLYMSYCKICISVLEGKDMDWKSCLFVLLCQCSYTICLRTVLQLCIR